MSALASAAEKVNTAWCKNDLRKEDQAREDGDAYCAIGALAAALIPQGMLLTIDGQGFGPANKILEADKFWFRAIGKGEDLSPEDFVAWNALTDEFENTYGFIKDTDEVRALAEVIMANYPDRINESDRFDNINAIVYAFNDHDDTTREDVVAMMEKADRLLEDRAVVEDRTADELVEEIDELLTV